MLKPQFLTMNYLKQVPIFMFHQLKGLPYKVTRQGNVYGFTHDIFHRYIQYPPMHLIAKSQNMHPGFELATP